MRPLVEKLNEFLAVIKQKWDSFRNVFAPSNKKKSTKPTKIFGTYSLGAKFHYIPHCYQLDIWKHSIGYLDEQSIEVLHQICSEMFG